MYPRTYYETFMRYEASHEVFVAMPFTKAFQQAYEKIIEPAITSVSIKGKPLMAKLINRNTTGSPDIHKLIFDAIIHSRVVIADLTVQSCCAGDDGAVRWQANANVSYEVGLASAWRNPEDILLIHQKHREHSYSFDIQNLRHLEYDVEKQSSVNLLANELVRSINQSTFLAQQTFVKVIQSISPSAVQFMHHESRRAFPVISFSGDGMPIMDTRVHAITGLLAVGALKSRNVLRAGNTTSVIVVYKWTEFGLRIMEALHAINQDRRMEMVNQIESVPEDAMPPAELVEFPKTETSADGTASGSGETAESDTSPAPAANESR